MKVIIFFTGIFFVISQASASLCTEYPQSPFCENDDSFCMKNSYSNECVIWENYCDKNPKTQSCIGSAGTPHSPPGSPGSPSQPTTPKDDGFSCTINGKACSDEQEEKVQKEMCKETPEFC